MARFAIRPGTTEIRAVSTLPDGWAWLPDGFEFTWDGDMLDMLVLSEHPYLRDRTEAEKLAALKIQRKAALYQRRVQAEKSSFQHDGHWYDGSDDSIERFGVVAQQITWAIMAGVPMETQVIVGGWRDLDDVGGPSTIAELQAMLQSHYQHGVLCEQNSQALKAAINAATTTEELDAVDLEIGWPS